MDEPVVSVIIPSYGRSEYLSDALMSVNRQTYENIEIIVVETPTSDQPELDSLDSRLDWDCRYPLNHIRTDMGVNSLAARNIGIKASSGDYIAFLDDDDKWLQSKAQTQVVELSSTQQNVAASITGNHKVDTQGRSYQVYTPVETTSPLSYQLCWNIGTFSMLMVNSNIFDDIGLLDEQIEGCGDQDFLVRIAKQFEFCNIDMPLVLKRSGGQGQLSHDYEKRKRAHSRFRDKHGHIADRLGIRDEMEAALEFSLGRIALENGRYSTGRYHFLMSIKHQPLNRGYYMYLLLALSGRLGYRLGTKIVRRGWI